MSKRTSALLHFCLIGLLAGPGCGPSGDSPAKADDEAEQSAVADPDDAAEEDDGDDGGTQEQGPTRKDWDPALGTATIGGQVKFSGKPPLRKPLDMAEDAQCGKLHGEKLPREQAVIVSTSGSLKNVFVWVAEGLEGWKFPVPRTPAVLKQQGCRFVPHVMGLRVDQQLKISNQDPVTHNVHAFARKNRNFNFSQSKGGTRRKVFDEAEVGLRLQCDIHSWMGSYLGVVAHPYFAVTGEDGAFKLAGLPPGSYTVKAWHERLGTQSFEVTVGDREGKALNFSFAADADEDEDSR